MDPTIVAVITILSLSAFVRSAIGFGDALVAMGLLTGWVGLQIASPLVALVSAVISSVILANQWRQFQRRAALPLILWTMAGIPFGLALLKVAPDHLARAALGILLISYGAYGLLGLKLPLIKTNRWRGLFGFVAGVAGGAYNVNGAFIAIYGTLKRWEPEQFRLLLQGYFFFTNFLILAGHAIAGLWTRQVWSLLLLSLPTVGASIWLGGIANRHIKRELFGKLVFGLLLAIGLLSLYQVLSP
jgi:uncharacterized membrane protein YfcA